MNRLAIALALVSLVGCGGKPDVPPAPAPMPAAKPEPKELTLTDEDKQMMAEPLVALQFEHFGVPLEIDAPKGVKIQPGFNTSIQRGGYLVAVSGTRNIDQLKKTAKESTLHKFLGVVVDEPNLYAYKHEDYDGSIDYIFVYNAKVGDREFAVHNDTFSPTPKTKEHFDWVLKSAKSLRLKK